MPELTYRYRLYPTKQQAKDIMRTCSCVRFLYNKLLEDRTAYYRETKKWKKLDRTPYSALPFMANVDPNAMGWAQNSLETAYRNFFHTLRTRQDRYRPESKMKAEQDKSYVLMDTDLVSYPRFKKKKTSKESYTTYLKDLTVQNNRIHIPSVGKVKIRFHRPLPEDAQQICSTVLKKPSGHYYLLIRLMIPEVPEKKELEQPLGVVFAQGKLVVRSDRQPVQFRHQQEDLTRRIEKTYKALKRRTPGSRRYEKLRLYLAGLYEHRVNQRRDDLHKAARHITNAGDAIYLQRPNVSARLLRINAQSDRQRQLDEAWWTFYTMVRYKCTLLGKRFWAVPGAFPAYFICSGCGHKIKAGENDDCSCPACGIKLERHINAACNLKNLAAKYIKEQQEIQ